MNSHVFRKVTETYLRDLMSVAHSQILQKRADRERMIKQIRQNTNNWVIWVEGKWEFSVSFLQLFQKKVKVAQSCPTLCIPMDYPWDSPGQNTGVGSCSLLQGIFPTQGSNPGLQHCRQILYQLSHQGSSFSEIWFKIRSIKIFIEKMIKQLGPPTGVRSAVYTLMALLVLHLGLHSTFHSLGYRSAPCEEVT